MFNYNARYFENEKTIANSLPDDLYAYKAYIGSHDISLESGDGVFYLSKDLKMAKFQRGPIQFKSEIFAVVIRGYAGPNREVSTLEGTFLPYVNGCSTRQLIPAERPGDPTFQMLHIPPYSSEQAHHIHSTARVVYILKGRGESVVGLSGKTTRSELKEGMVCVLDRMCPHHFETKEEGLIVLPVHVWSSIAGAEFNHPMFNGTFLINQGH